VLVAVWDKLPDSDYDASSEWDHRDLEVMALPVHRDNRQSLSKLPKGVVSCAESLKDISGTPCAEVSMRSEQEHLDEARPW
jgi:hypothetical protein